MLGYLLDVTWNNTYRIAKIKILSICGQNVKYRYYNRKGYKDLVFTTRLSHVEIEPNLIHHTTAIIRR